jgi:hypothetical protein
MNDWISIESIIMDYKRKNFHEGNFDEETFFIAAEEAIDEVLTADSHKEYVVLLDVYNQKASLPSNFVYPTQVAYRPDFLTEKIGKNDLRRYFVQTINSDYKDVRISECNSCKSTICSCEEQQWYPISTVNDQQQVKIVNVPQLASGYSKFAFGIEDTVPNFDETFISEIPHNIIKNSYEFPNSKSAKIYKEYLFRNRFSKVQKCPEFQIVRPSSNYFFNLPGLLQYCNVPAYDTNLEYRIENKIITINNWDYKCNKCKSCKENNKCESNYELDRKGELLVSYLGRRIDDKGFLLLPNIPYMIKAITDYIVAYLARYEYSKKQDNKSRTYFMDMQNIAMRSMTQSKNRYRIPDPNKWNHILNNIVHRRHPYLNRRENLNRYQPESDHFLFNAGTESENINSNFYLNYYNL